jgi:hypothetical protein
MENYWGRNFENWYDKTALQRMTAVISAKTGIKVAEGTWGYDSKRKILYYNPADFFSIPIDGIFGVLLHEIGHALYTPPFPLNEISELFEKYPEQMGWLFNSLENARIERLLRKTFPHSEKFLKEAFDSFLWKRKTYDDVVEEEKWETSYWDRFYWGDVYGAKKKRTKNSKKNSKKNMLSWWLAEEIDYARWGKTCFQKYRMPKKLAEIWKQVKPLMQEYASKDKFEDAAKVLDTIGRIAQPIFFDEPSPEFQEFRQICEEAKRLFEVLMEKKGNNALGITLAIGIKGGIGCNSSGEKIKFDTYEKIRKQVLPKAYSLISRIKSLQLTKKKIKEDFGFRSGKLLDTPRLWKHRLGYTRLFIRREVKESPTIPPFILLDDFSSSMSDGSVEIGIEASVLFSVALNNLKIKHAIIAFSDDIKVLKSFKEKEMSQSSIAIASEIERGGTKDFEAMHKAYELLKEIGCSANTRPIIIAFTDGESPDPDALKTEIDRLRKEFGAVVIGIGIGKDCTANYPIHTYIDDIQELPETIGKIIKTELTKIIKGR